MQAERPALPAVTTPTRKECVDDEDYEQLIEVGREFRTVPPRVHDVHANLSIGNLGFEESSHGLTVISRGSTVLLNRAHAPADRVDFTVLTIVP